MSYVATMGTSSCATIAIGGWKEGQKELNEKYKADPSSFKMPAGGVTVDQFYDKILFPTSQDLGRSAEMPFTKLMQDIDKGSLKTKFIIATLNLYQYQGNAEYWPNELRKHGFKLFAKCNNSIGTVNYIYMRNPNVVEIQEGEH